jgi:hypothetical protein
MLRALEEDTANESGSGVEVDGGCCLDELGIKPE